MPIAHQSSQQQQHHTHLFHAIGTFLHSRQTSHANGNTNPPSTSASDIVSGSSVPGGHDGSDVLLLYRTFESQLAKRLSSLLATNDTSCFTLVSFVRFLGVLNSTHSDLRSLISASRKQRRTMEDFVERSVKVLDVCRDIKEQITDVESLEVMLREVSPCLASKRGTGFAQGQVARAKRLLSQLLLQMEIEKVDEKPRQVEMRISFRGKLRERLNGHLYKDGSPQRWRSWPGHQDPAVPHGPGGSDGSAPSLHTSASAGHFSPSFSSSSNSSSGTGHQAWHGTHASHSFSAALSHASEVSRSLQSLELSLVPPKLVTRDEEECFAAAIYAFNAVSVFFLGTITASFPNLGSKTHVISTINPPSSFAWSSAFLSLQEKVQEEIKAQRQRGLGKICMWELEQVFSFMKRLSELTSSYPFPWSSEQEEDVKRVVSQFDLQIYNLGQDLNALNAHITDFYNQIVFARFEAFEILMNID